MVFMVALRKCVMLFQVAPPFDIVGSWRYRSPKQTILIFHIFLQICYIFIAFYVCLYFLAFYIYIYMYKYTFLYFIVFYIFFLFFIVFYIFRGLAACAADPGVRCSLFVVCCRRSGGPGASAALLKFLCKHACVFT